MMKCDSTILTRSLDECLSEAEEESLAAHLCDCDTCQRELEKLAGQPAAWNRVGTTLKTASGSGDCKIPAVNPGYIADLDSTSDFAVDCLEPSSSPEYIGPLGDIEIQEVIGHGGMGVVLKGYQSELKRLVAVKVLAPQLAMSAAARKRFTREAQATAAILHPNVMPILTVNSGGRLPYIVMPFVPCESLQQRVDRCGTMELVDILRIGTQTANGLAAAHAQGLVHRDVKPANILLEIGVEKVMLTDFGLARAIDGASITRTGIIAGTPLYMSPEQSRGEPVDARSDLFSLGSVLYTLGSVLYTLGTGRTPFRAESTYGILRRLSEDTPRRVREISPHFPAWFEMIVHKLLAKNPGDRFAIATEVAQLLEGCLAHVQQPATVPLPAECARWSKHRRLGMWVSIAVILFCIPGGWWALNHRPHLESLETGTEHPTTVNPATDWDAGKQEVSPLRNDFDQWNRNAQKLWEESP